MQRLSRSTLILLVVLSLLLAACGIQTGPVAPSVPGDPWPSEDDTDVGRADNYTELIALIAASREEVSSHGWWYGGLVRGLGQEKAESRPADTAAQQNDYSQTNIQVAGVDEADIIKTDGRYLYLVANSRLYVVDTQAEKGMQVVSLQKIKPYTEDEKTITHESARELFLDKANQRLILIISGSVHEKYIPEEEPVKPDAGEPEPDRPDGETEPGASDGQAEPGETEETTSPDRPDSAAAARSAIAPDRMWIPYYNSRSYTTTRIYDISDPTQPDLVRRFTQDGYYTTARMIGRALYVVTNRYEYRIYDETLKTDQPETFLPSTCEDPHTEDWKALPADRIMLLPDSNIASQTILAALDTVDTGKEADVLSLLGSSGTVYASLHYLYVAAWRNRQRDGAQMEVETEIYRFQLSEARVRAAGKGAVPGWIINQFSMDEHDGYFRIATTTGEAWTAENPSKNNLYILNQSLRIVGKVTGLAPGETIKSVRFMGDQAYVVTFRTVDPLFVIDLSTPDSPRVLGELKIPGYSTYLHPYAENRLLGFGYDVMAEGDSLFHLGLKLSLFDISDLANPQEISILLLGGSGSHAEVLYNHKSLLFSREKNIIAFPAYLTPRQGSKMQYDDPCFQGLLVIGIDQNGQLAFRDSVSHSSKLNDPFGKAVRLEEKDYQAIYGYDAIYRAVYIGDTLYTCSGRQVRSSSLADFKQIAQVELPGYDDEQSYYPYDGVVRFG